MKTQRTVQFLHVRNTIKGIADISNLSFKELKERLDGKVLSGTSLERYTAMVLSIFKEHTCCSQDSY